MGDEIDLPGDFRNAEVNLKSTVIKVFTDATPSEVAASELTAATERLAVMPLDTVPSVTTLPAWSVMPMAANPLFVGREDDLMALAKAFVSGGTAAIGQVAAASGIGGIGKTQLAAEFAQRYGSYFQGGVFWLSFANAATVSRHADNRTATAGRGHAQTKAGSSRCDSSLWSWSRTYLCQTWAPADP